MASEASTNAPRVNQAALARSLGVSRQAIGDLVRRSVLTLDADGLIDVQLAREALQNAVRPSAKTAGALAPSEASTSTAATLSTDPTSPIIDTPSVTSYHVAKTLREIAEAKIAQHKLGEMQGSLVARARVENAIFEVTRGLRDGLANCSRRVSAEVAPLLTPDECEAVIAREHRQLLAEFARSLAQQIASSASSQPAATPPETTAP